jgi:cell division transport system permease protein
VIELLHRLGADDGDIAAPYQRQAVLFGLLGGAGGAVAGALTLLAFGGSALSVHFADWRAWVVAIGVALATGLIAMAAARVMLLRRLARMP